MPAIITCPECQAKLRLPPPLSPGKKFRCPRCQKIVTVAAEDEAPAAARPRAVPPAVAVRRPPTKRVEEEEADAPRRPARTLRRREEVDEYEEGERERPRRREKKQGSGWLIWCLVALAGVGVLCGGGGFALFWMWPQDKDWTASSQPSTRGSTPHGGQGVDREWTPDPDQLALLRPETTARGYTMRPPKGYALKEQQVGPKVHIFLWTGPDRLNGTHSLVALNLMTLEGGDKEKSLETTLDEYLTGMRTSPGLGNLASSEIEKGQVDGLAFIRCRLKNVTPQGVQMHGFQYVALDGSTGVAITGIDFEPDAPASLKALEAAALTLKRNSNRPGQ